MRTTQKTRTDATLPMLLRSFKLPAFVREYGPTAARAAAEGLSHAEYLLALAETEAAERDARRTARRLEESRLPREKTLGNYDLDRLPVNRRAVFSLIPAFIAARSSVSPSFSFSISLLTCWSLTNHALPSSGRTLVDSASLCRGYSEETDPAVLVVVRPQV